MTESQVCIPHWVNVRITSYMRTWKALLERLSTQFYRACFWWDRDTGSSPHRSSVQSPLHGVRWAMSPVTLEETGFIQRPVSSHVLRTWENCLSNDTVKSHFSGVFNCSKENSIATLGPTGRTMSMSNTFHQILCSYPEALEEQTSPSQDTNQFLSQIISVSFSFLYLQLIFLWGFLLALALLLSVDLSFQGALKISTCSFHMSDFMC